VHGLDERSDDVVPEGEHRLHHLNAVACPTTKDIAA